MEAKIGMVDVLGLNLPDQIPDGVIGMWASSVNLDNIFTGLGYVLPYPYCLSIG